MNLIVSHMGMPKLVGTLYRNGKKIGEVSAAVEGPHEVVKQAGQSKPLETRKRYTLKTTANVIVGMGENEVRYEIDSNDEKRLRVFPQKSAVKVDDTLFELLVALEE